ncbi:glycosyltransferase family 39 protein [Sphingomonas sp.]|uniref:glycosyltransferase family 39 protein n=1 Tax=Sphingomonas sp. TaxID=28214 RepID=UPI003B3BD186
MLAAFGLLLRGWDIFAAPLWLDEAYSAYAASHDWAFLWRIVPLYETHPPFYYSLLHLWVALFGDSMPALRLLGLSASLATLPAVIVAAREAAYWIGWGDCRRRRLQAVALAFACVSLALVEMAREVRPYPLMILVYAGALALLLRLARRIEREQPIGCVSYGGYLLLEEALLWLHNLGPLFGLALTIALAIALFGRRLTRADWAWLVAGHMLVAMLYLPGLAILRAQAQAWTASTWLQFRLDRLLLDRIMTLYGVAGWAGLASPVLAICAIVALSRRRSGGRLAAVLATLALVPVCCAILVSLTVTPIFITRIMTPVAVPALLLLAIGATSDGAYWRARAAAALLLGGSMLAGNVQSRMRGPETNWYRTVDWLMQHAQPGDVVFAYPNEGKLPLAYALRDKGRQLPIRAIPTDVPALEQGGGWHPTGTRGVSVLPPATLHAVAQEPATQAVPTIWLLRLGPSTFDPDDRFLHELHRGRSIVRHWRDGAIDIVGLRKLPTHAAR